MKHYLFFLSHAYSYSILRPLQAEIRRRQDQVKWYLEDTCPDMLLPGEERLTTFQQVSDYNPIAVFAPGNWVYDFFPGVKVCLFHGYPIQKRKLKTDEFFDLRGWFDIYCTQGESGTETFRQLADEKGYFRVYETGWCHTDAMFDEAVADIVPAHSPCILYAPTFTRSLSSAWEAPDVIEQILQHRDWHWMIALHPKITDGELLQRYEALGAHERVTLLPINEGVRTYKQSDAMLSDSSSVIMQYMLLDKPVVTLRNSHPGAHLIDVQQPADIERALDEALQRPPRLMEAIRQYTAVHEAHRDGKNSARVLDAVNDFIANWQGRLKRKPLNLFRKLKLRWRLKYFPAIGTK